VTIAPERAILRWQDIFVSFNKIAMRILSLGIEASRNN
jgi:hypothetical protein